MNASNQISRLWLAVRASPVFSQLYFGSYFAVAKFPAIVHSADAVSTLSHFSDSQKITIFLYFFKNATLKILKDFLKFCKKSAERCVSQGAFQDHVYLVLIFLYFIMYLHKWPPLVAIFLALWVWEAFGVSWYSLNNLVFSE